jgi:hypothetical protein
VEARRSCPRVDRTRRIRHARPRRSGGSCSPACRCRAPALGCRVGLPDRRVADRELEVAGEELVRRVRPGGRRVERVAEREARDDRRAPAFVVCGLRVHDHGDAESQCDGEGAARAHGHGQPRPKVRFNRCGCRTAAGAEKSHLAVVAHTPSPDGMCNETATALTLSTGATGPPIVGNEPSAPD